MPKVIGVIQARMGSERFPGKLLAPLAGRPLLHVLVERVRAAQVDEWWIATTEERTDDVTAAWGRSLGLEVFRGDRVDVLSRFAAIASIRRPEWIVRLTGDNPFVDSVIVDALVAAARSAPERVDHVAEGAERHLPLGYVPEIVRASSILKLQHTDLPAHHRTHVTSRIRERGATAALPIDDRWPPRPGWRWTVDTTDDHAMADAAFLAFGSRGSVIDYPAMAELLDAQPAITSRNAGVRQKEMTDG